MNPTLGTCPTTPKTEFWTNEKWWYHHIHDGKVGDEPLLTPQDETFAILCFKNYYCQWEKDFHITKAKHPQKKLVVPPLIPTLLKWGLCQNEVSDHQNLRWLGDKIHQLHGQFSIVQWMDQCRQGTVQEIVETRQVWLQQTHYSCQRSVGLCPSSTQK
jgi:hypothetical protein